MAITHKQTLSILPSSGTNVTATFTETGSSEVLINDVIPLSSTNLLRTLTITAANIQSIFMLASTDLTIKTNSSGSPANTINLKAGIPLVWSISSAYFTCPITTNVTAFYQTNGAAVTSLTMRVLTT